MLNEKHIFTPLYKPTKYKWMWVILCAWFAVKYNLFHIPLVIGNTHQTWKYLHSFCAMSQPVTQNLWYNLWLPQVDLNKRSGREFISKAKANKMFMPNINYYDILRRCNRLFEIFGHCPAKLKVHFQTHPLIFINVLAYNTQF